MKRVYLTEEQHHNLVSLFERRLEDAKINWIPAVPDEAGYLEALEAAENVEGQG